jgi:hypothetical protein
MYQLHFVALVQTSCSATELPKVIMLLRILQPLRHSILDPTYLSEFRCPSGILWVAHPGAPSTLVCPFLRCSPHTDKLSILLSCSGHVAPSLSSLTQQYFAELCSPSGTLQVPGRSVHRYAQMSALPLNPYTTNLFCCLATNEPFRH